MSSVSLWNEHLQGDMKANRQLPVRFVHAPCVKLTLMVRRTADITALGLGTGRVLRIDKDPQGGLYRTR
jgi:hypothetical protein